VSKGWFAPLRRRRSVQDPGVVGGASDAEGGSGDVEEGKKVGREGGRESDRVCVCLWGGVLSACLGGSNIEGGINIKVR
jgi:hypothetical protein